MKRIPLQWVGLATAAALLVAGCTAQPQNGNRVNQSNVFTTTGDDDQCAAALGNPVNMGGFWGIGAAGRNVSAANGLIIGNVALVALPDQAAGAAVTPPAANQAGVTERVRSNAIAAGNTAAPDATGTGTAGTMDTVPSKAGTTVGDTGLTGRPGVDTDGDGHIAGAEGTLAQTGNAAGTGTAGGTATGVRPGTAARPGGGTTTGAGQATTRAGTVDGAGRATGNGIARAIRRQTAAGRGTTTAAVVQRIRTACPRVAEIRVVNTEADRRRLAEITAAVRSGRPVTEFMTDLVGIAQRATSAGAGANPQPPTLTRPTTQNPTTQAPGTGTPAMQAPMTQTLMTQTPATQTPAPKSPATQTPTGAERRTGGPGPAPSE
ncbi:MAG: hypothetical protein AB2385_07420 [Symbiobacterium sp.]|uniref:hypothetical protein n=1 Tax=Symbiobacterium sp. TaxID=1971213 RepID=UPI003464C48B